MNECAKVAVVALSILVAPAVQAQPSVGSKALAEHLFREGRALMKAGKADEACPKFEESQRLDPHVGTLLNLAICHEATGRTASAWVEFTQAGDQATRAHDTERAELARAHQLDLEPRLSRLRVKVLGPASNVTLSLDSRPIGPTAWETPFPIDAGGHTLEATAPGCTPWSTSLAVAAQPGESEILVPRLECRAAVPLAASSSAAARPRPGPPGPAEPTGGAGRTLGVGLGALGLVGIGVGTYFGVRTFALKNDADAWCPNDRCSPRGHDYERQAHDAATTANVAFAAGAAFLGAGLCLVLFSPSAGRRAVRLAPSLASTHVGMDLGAPW